MPSDIERLDLPIVQGKTFQQIIRWEIKPFVYVPIQSITRGAPARITCQSAHGLVDGWRVAVVGAHGMRQINAEQQPPAESDLHRATIVSSTVIDLNELVTADFTAHTTGSGSLQFYTAADLNGCTARMTVRDRVGGTSLLSLTTENGRIVLDDVAKTITLLIAAVDTAALTWKRGVYDLEIENGSGFVTGLYQGAVTVSAELTT